MLSPAELVVVAAAAARVDEHWRQRMGIGPTERMDLLDSIGRAPEFLESLLAHPKVFPKVVGLLGPNIALCAPRTSTILHACALTALPDQGAL